MKYEHISILLPAIAFLMISCRDGITAKKETRCGFYASGGDVTPVQELISEYKKNPISFDASRKGKCVAVSGRVAEMSTTLGYSITLVGSEPMRVESCQEIGTPWCSKKGYALISRTVGDLESFPHVVVSVPESEIEKVTQLQVGRSDATFLGRVSGIVDGTTIRVSNAEKRLEIPHKQEQQYNAMVAIFLRQGGRKAVWISDLIKDQSRQGTPPSSDSTTTKKDLRLEATPCFYQGKHQC